jgi:cytochrome P450
MLMAPGGPAFRWREVTKSLIPVDGETAVVVSDGDEYKRRRRLVQPAFGTKRINAHLGLMADEAVATLATWTPGRRLDAYEELRATVRRAVTRALFGSRLRGAADDLGDRLQPALDFVNLPQRRQLKIDLPWTPWHRAKRARRRTDDVVFAEIAHRRAHGSESDDVLTWLLDAQSDEDAPLSDEELRDQVVSLIAAGYETTSAGVGWTLWELLREPERFERLRAEVEAVAGDRPLTVEDLGRMPYLDGVVSEGLRLWPPGLFGGRYSTEPFELCGHTIPAHRRVLYSPYVTHRLPELWDAPLEFRPERWGSGEPAPYGYVPFGGGYRRCLGFAFALQEMKVVLAEVARRVRLRLLTTDPGRAGLATLYPARGVEVEVLS